MSDQTIRHRQTPSAAAVHASLRGWARGSYGDEAAVELLIRTFGGRFALPGWPWVAPRERPGEYCLDADAINPAIGQLSGAEQRVLAVVAALSGNEPLERNLTDVISGVDRGNQTLILAALSHAGGSHQHNDYQRHPEGTYTITEAGALFPWPDHQRTRQGSDVPTQPPLDLTIREKPGRRRAADEAYGRTSPGVREASTSFDHRGGGR